MKRSLLLLSIICTCNLFAQLVPSASENIPFIVTFGNEAKLSYGDDDFSQVFFFKIPKNYNKPFYIRIYDPDIGGENDEIIGDENTKTKFMLYGGAEAFTGKHSKSVDPKGEYKKGNLIHSKTFDNSKIYDNKWYNIGPINPHEGEYVEEFDANIFKLIAEGIKGDDGNLYKYFLSSLPVKNVAIENGNAFTYEYSVRLHNDSSEVSHIYPFINDQVVAIKQHNFDWDNDGKIIIYSVKKSAEPAKTSNDANWAISVHNIENEERGSCLDIQMVKNKASPYKRNNVVFYITNQYDELLPFFSVPIGEFSPANKKIKVE